MEVFVVLSDKDNHKGFTQETLAKTVEAKLAKAHPNIPSWNVRTQIGDYLHSFAQADGQGDTLYAEWAQAVLADLIKPDLKTTAKESLAEPAKASAGPA